MSSAVATLQFALQNTSFTRIAPYAPYPCSAEPDCIIDDRTFDFCAEAYAHSRCSNTSYADYPIYDARCRSFYHVGYRGGDTSKVYFSDPYISVIDDVLQTAATIPFKANPAGELTGIVAVNFRVGDLSDAINAIRILTHGYCYVVSRTDTSTAIVHPNLIRKRTCNASLYCLEALFAPEEFASFYSTILLPLQTTGSTEQKQYIKGGSLWRLAYEEVSYGTIDYILIATGPEYDIVATANKVNKIIHEAVKAMVIVLTIIGTVLFIILVVVSKKVVDSVVSPLEKLREYCQSILAHNLDFIFELEGSSQDMRVLLHSFSDLLIYIRFSNTNNRFRYHPETCEDIFEEALQIFGTIQNRRGEGACRNNLGGVFLSASDFTMAFNSFQMSIEVTDDLLRSAGSEEERGTLLEQLSDRIYNLALVYIEQGRVDAHNYLINAINEDEANQYNRGIVTKTIALGQYYLKYSEYESAHRELEGVKGRIKRLSKDDAMIARQMRLRTMGYCHESNGNILLAEVCYLQALCQFSEMHVCTAKKAIFALLKLWKSDPSKADRIRSMNLLTKHLNFDVGDPRAIGTVYPKRVVFVVDYTASMSGSKIVAAVQTARHLHEGYMYNQDRCALVVCSSEIKEVVVLNTNSADHHERMSLAFDTLSHPRGGSRWTDALSFAIALLGDPEGAQNDHDWVVLLTDGEDSRVEERVALSNSLRSSSVGLIIAGIGEHVAENVLIELCRSASEGKGHFLRNPKNPSDLSSLKTKFNQLDRITQSDVIFHVY